MISILKAILEILYLFSILFLVKHYIGLFRNVVKLRRESKTSLGYKNKELERAIRAHANFCETVPISMLLSIILYFHNLLWIAFPSLLLLIIGRKIHAKAISDINEDVKLRVKGMKLTIISIKLSCLGIIFLVFKKAYFYLQSIS
ncbi:MAG: glutathione S-transferase [Rickettsiales bacterium]|nr:glutathione S-transferase [Rickettsiales bacterium]|tara:strand:+ start:25 stop:459 length:435 start_codon:yes stop_codon:yes gene_type:complete